MIDEKKSVVDAAAVPDGPVVSQATAAAAEAVPSVQADLPIILSQVPMVFVNPAPRKK
ncbi:MAG TPA: hypothetical protein VE981_22310 [Planctomycetota bacterium]|nr:hypothetical protein [Planctomycetota bacterium]